jgi:hypothetical protein
MRTPGNTIRAYCVYCNGGVFKEVESCDADGKDPNFKKCPFHPYRMGKGKPSVKLIRKFCLQCMGVSERDNSNIVGECETIDCLCFPYRFGKNPNFRLGDGPGRIKRANLERS